MIVDGGANPFLPVQSSISGKALKFMVNARVGGTFAIPRPIPLVDPVTRASRPDAIWLVGIYLIRTSTCGWGSPGTEWAWCMQLGEC